LRHKLGCQLKILLVSQGSNLGTNLNSSGLSSDGAQLLLGEEAGMAQEILQER